MAKMTGAEIDAFLAGPVICRLGCVDFSGWPYVVPVWMQWTDGGFFIVPRERSAWAEFLLHDPRVALCLDDREQHRRVLVKGRATIQEEPNVGGRWVPILREMAERYWGARGIEYHERTLAEPRWLVRVEPLELTSWYGTWAQRYRHFDWEMTTPQ